MNTAKCAFMTVCPNGQALEIYSFWYAAEQENVLLPTDAKILTSGNPAYKRLRAVKVAEKPEFHTVRQGLMHKAHLAWVFSGEPMTERCQPTR